MNERLWAPWRLPYIEQASSNKSGEDDCIFVDLPAKENDRENLILHRGKSAFVMLNRFPYTNGHLMVAPYKHTAEMKDLSDEELLEINKLIARSLEWLKIAYKPDGFNIGVNLGRPAGAGVPSHIHWHIVPRWEGDTNFMGVVGETRVLPQSLEDSYDRLKEIVNRDA